MTLSPTGCEIRNVTYGVIELIQPILILKNTREDALIEPKEEKCGQTTGRNPQLKRSTPSVPVSHDGCLVKMEMPLFYSVNISNRDLR